MTGLVVLALLSRYGDIAGLAINIRGDREGWNMRRLEYQFGLVELDIRERP